MKFKFTYFLLAGAALLSSCLGGGDKVAPTPKPDGTYSGEFRLLHRDQHTGIIDTQKTNLTVYISPVSTSTYTVTGDTTTLHAGSKGSFSFVGEGGILFTDKTYSPTAPVTKTHLNGLYAFTYDGASFKMVAYGALDTLALQYDLKKTGN
ncbi:MAG TPA: hypothetical protein VIM55_13655 [Mucilaginibacter sp.]